MTEVYRIVDADEIEAVVLDHGNNSLGFLYPDHNGPLPEVDMQQIKNIAAELKLNYKQFMSRLRDGEQFSIKD